MKQSGKVILINFSDNNDAIVFVHSLNKEIHKFGFTEISIEKETKFISEEPIEQDIIVIINDDALCGNQLIHAYLEKAIENNSQIWPVAINKESRMPLDIIKEKQSFDVYDELRKRNLNKSYLTTVARVFSRKIVSRLMPSFYNEECKLFFSHRRIDGEEITASIIDKVENLINDKGICYRDIAKVFVGDAAQDSIDEAMSSMDVFVFVNTKEIGNSDWIKKEVMYAIGHNIPILWIQVDNAVNPFISLFKYKESHIKINSADINDEYMTAIADEVLTQSFELIMESSSKILSKIESIKHIFNDSIEEINQIQKIFKISVERKGYNYPQRKIEQYIQIYGRNPSLIDLMQLEKNVNVIEKQNVDSIIALTDKINQAKKNRNCVIENTDNFEYVWSRYLEKQGGENRKMEIVISGAFPEADVIYKNNLQDALLVFEEVLLRANYGFTFGAHPSFQDLFYEKYIKENTSPTNMLKMFISRRFLSSYDEVELRRKYNLVITDTVGDLKKDLTELRKKMIQRESVKALVCLGGLIKEDKSEEGVREEVALAVEAGIPVFLVGSVGGTSSVLASEYEGKWDMLNDAGAMLNEEFEKEINYYKLAYGLISYLEKQ